MGVLYILLHILAPHFRAPHFLLSAFFTRLNYDFKAGQTNHNLLFLMNYTHALSSAFEPPR